MNEKNWALLLVEGDSIYDKVNDAECNVTERTTNSFRVFVPARTDAGIDSNDWYTQKEIEDKFTQ